MPAATDAKSPNSAKGSPSLNFSVRAKRSGPGQIVLTAPATGVAATAEGPKTPPAPTKDITSPHSAFVPKQHRP